MLVLTDDMPGLKARLDDAGVVRVGAQVSYENSREPTDAFAVYDPNRIRVTFAYKSEENLEEIMNK